MQDVEIESLLTEAGYAFNLESARYDVLNATEDEVSDHSTEEVADILEIPIEDLQRWEGEQLPAAE